MPTIEKRGNTYRITVSCGYDVSGKQIRQCTTWKPASGLTSKQIDKELKRQAVLFEERVQSGQFIGSDVKFADFAAQWFESYGKEHLKATTYKNYTDCMKRINTAIGHIQLCKLQPVNIIKFYENLSESGIREDIKYKPCKDIKALLKRNGYTQCAFAELCGLSIGTVRALSKGENVNKKTAEAVCKVLNIPLQTLFSPCSNGHNTVSGATVLYYHHVISSILTTAVQWQIIAYNPCERVKPPKAEHKEAKYLDETQALHLLECLDNEPLQYKTIFTLLLFSGMRRGELCGLTWSDIDLERNIIDINKSSLYLSSRGVFDDDTKNSSSHRVIKIPFYAVELLKQHQASQAAEQLRLGDRWAGSGKVFTTFDGKPIHPDTVSGWFHDFIKRYDLPKITVHSLRHTNATLMIASGTDIKTVSKRLGHANVTTTGNIYTHAIKSADEAAADTLQDILSPAKSHTKTG